MTRPSTAITVSWPDDTIRLRSVTGPIVQRREQAREARTGRVPERGCESTSSCHPRSMARRGRSTAPASRMPRPAAERDRGSGGRSPAIVRAMEDRAIAARWLGPDGLPRRVGPPEATRGRPAPTDGSATSCCSSSIRPSSRSAGRPTSRMSSPTAGRARATGHRGAARRARRRGDLPRAGPAGRLPDPAARRPRPAPAALRPRPRGGARRHVPRVRRRGRPARRAPGLLGGRRMARRRARSARSGSASSAGVAYHGIALNVDVDLADFDLIDPCGMPGLVSTSIAAELGRPERGGRPPTTSPAPRPCSRRPSPATWARRWTATCRPSPIPPPNARPSSGSPTPCRPEPDRRRGREPGPVRAPQGRDHRLVGRDGRRPHVRARAVRPRRPSQIEDRGDCFNCRIPAGDGIRLRTLKDFAFTVAGTEEEAHAREGSVAQVTLSDARAAGAWSTVVAPPQRAPAAARRRRSEVIEGLLQRCRDEIGAARRAARTQHLQVVQNWGAQAGARTNHLCFDLYDLPQIPHRIAEELGGAARFLIREGECPYCRLVREEVRRPDHLLYADDHAVAFAPYASRSPFEVWVVPRRHDADFSRASDADLAAAAEALRQVLGRLAASLDGPPYNLVLHTRPAPGGGRRDVPLALGDPPTAARDRRPRARDRPAGQPGLAGGRGRGAADGPGGGRDAGASDCDDAAGGGRRHTPSHCLSLRHRRSERNAPDRRAHPIDTNGARRGRRPVRARSADAPCPWGSP